MSCSAPGNSDSLKRELSVILPWLEEELRTMKASRPCGHCKTVCVRNWKANRHPVFLSKYRSPSRALLRNTLPGSEWYRSFVVSSPCLVMRAQSPRIRSGRKKIRRRPYSHTVRYDQEGNGPTSAAARHKCRAGQLFQRRTGTAQFIRQEGISSMINSPRVESCVF